MQAITCGTLIDGLGDEPICDATVVIEEGRIVEAGPTEDIPVTDEATERHVPDRTVLPGLIDSHVHLHGVRTYDKIDRYTNHSAHIAAHAIADLEELLAAGFTSVRDLGSRTGVGLQRAESDGAFKGARVYTSGLRFSQTAGHGDTHELPHEWMDGDQYGYTEIVDGPAECRKGVRKRLRQGVDVIKLLTTGGVVSREDGPDQPHFSATEVETIVEEANRFDVPVACHAQGGAGVRLALESGVHSVEHGFRLDEELIDRFLETGSILVPTMTLLEQLVEHGPEYGLAEYAQEKACETQQDHIRSIQRAHEAGVPIAVGTDLNGTPLLPHGINIREFELYVEEVGMTPMEAIQAGTSVAARAIDDDSVGAIVPGRRADLVMTKTSPLEDISGLREIDVVYKDGEKISEN